MKKTAIITLGLLSFSQNSFSNENFLNGWKGYLHIEQAETKYTVGEVDNGNPGQPFTRGQLSLNKNFDNNSWLMQYDVSYEAYPMEKWSDDGRDVGEEVTDYIFSNKFNIQRNLDILNLGVFANYSISKARGDDEMDDIQQHGNNNFWHYGIQANKFFDNTKTRLGFSYGQVKGEDAWQEGIAHDKPGNNYNYYAQQYLNDNLRVGYSLNLLDGGRDIGDGLNDRAKVTSHLVNLEYYFSPKYPIALTASYEIIDYKPGQAESHWPDAKEFKLGIKYIFGGEKSLMAFDKGRISHQANVENYWTHLANEIE
jgi:hypothetical protein